MTKRNDQIDIVALIVFVMLRTAIHMILRVLAPRSLV